MKTRDRVERIEKEISGVTAQYGITDWEKTFLASVKKVIFPTDKQEECLKKIEAKVFPEEVEA